METASKPAADVRAASVARLRRATSLPRMKDGRRPAVTGSDGDTQEVSAGITPSASAATTPFVSTGELPPLAQDPTDLATTKDVKGERSIGLIVSLITKCVASHL